MSHDNHITKAEISSIIKKFQVFRPITFRSWSIPQEIQKSIKLWDQKSLETVAVTPMS